MFGRKNKDAPEKLKADAKAAAVKKINDYKAARADASTTVTADATLSVNRNFEAAEVRGVWYVRNKHVGGEWILAITATAFVCQDLKAGKEVSIDRRQIVV